MAASMHENTNMTESRDGQHGEIGIQWTSSPQENTCPAKIRMWFPPHGFEGQRGGPSGIYLSATVLMGSDTHYKVVFDGETAPEVVPIDTCTPVVPEDASVASYHVEGDTLRVGEFCEVDNAPGFGFLFGRIKETGLHAYTVSFPFGDRGTMENVPAYSVRRALVFDMSTNEWKEIDPDCDPSTSLVGDPTMLPLVASRHMKTLDVHHDAAPVVAGADRGCRGVPESEPTATGEAAAGNIAESTKRKRGKKRDKDAPKRAKSCYIVFLDRHRQEVREKNPDAGMKEIVSILAEMWKSVAPEERALCEAIALKDKERYTREMKTYEPPVFLPEDDGKDAPKRPRSGYILYSMDYRSKFSDPSCRAVNDPEMFKEFSKIIGEKWSSMSDEDRSVWLNKSKVEHEAYAVAQREYIEKKNREATKQVHILAGRIAKARDVFPGVCKGTPVSGLEMSDMHKGIRGVARDKAYYMVVDALRPGSANRKAVCESASHYLVRRENPDWKAFLVSCFGLEKANELFHVADV